jgi:hypothetical protein
MARWKLLVANPNREPTATPGDDPFILKLESQCSEGRFEARSAFFISSQRICHSKRVRVERATDGNSGLPEARAPQILDRR